MQEFLRCCIGAKARPRLRRTALQAVGLIFWLFTSFAAFCQGIPFTQNFGKHQYRGGTQNWAITQDDDGIIYIANNKGLLEFDGKSWRITPVDNQTIVRSLAFGKNSKIWAGAQSEFGYFEPNPNGILTYHSLRNLLPATPIADVWRIAVADEHTTFFQTSKLVFSIKGTTTLKPFQPISTFVFFGKANGRILAQDIQAGLMEWTTGDSLKVIAPPPPKFGIISSLMPWSKDTILLTTQNGYIWALSGNQISPWHTEADDFLLKNRIYTATVLADGKLALGTSQGGIVILDRQRKPFVFLNKKNGLQNNNILSLFTDRQGNLWAGSDNGVDYILVNSPFSFLLPDGDLEGAAYCANLDGPWAYFGTNNGLYATPLPPDKTLAHSTFSLVQNTQGQVWGISKVNQELFVGHHDGPYRLSHPLRADPIGFFTGPWTFMEIEGHENLMLVGAYHGLHLFQRRDNTWQIIKSYPEFYQESCRILAMESPHILWIAHPYRGIYRAEFSPDFLGLNVSFFNSQNGLPSDISNYVYKIGSEILFTTEKGILTFDDLKGAFEPYPLLNDFFPSPGSVKYLHEGPNGEIWFVAGDEVGYLEVSQHKPSRKYHKRTIPFLKGKILSGFEFILPYSPHHVLFGTDRGFIFYNRRPKPNRPPGVLLRDLSFSSPKDSLVATERKHQFLHSTSNAPMAFKRKENSFKFGFSLPWYGQHERIEYAYLLEGLDTHWSEWSEKTEKEYANLSPGTYSFKVKARFSESEETPPSVYRFRIAPPWFANRLAYLFYFLLAAGILGYLVIAPKQRFKREKEFLTTEHQRKEEDHRRRTEAAKLELDRVKQEKLQAEIDYKNKELASTTLHLLQKGEILHKIQDDIQRIARTCNQPDTRKDLLSLTKVLAQDAQLDADWGQFAQHFDQVHSEFLRRLRERFPELTPRDQKLCAYLRMNLSTKEIAPLLNISVRGVEISRYRLRKKLHLEKEANLTDFLLNF
ncbi:MAG: hypothetical protein IPN74_10460 [Haliscomenobacter sp.]|nr:hypothetical protein [Haliscomenobacter sp.]